MTAPISDGSTLNRDGGRDGQINSVQHQSRLIDNTRRKVIVAKRIHVCICMLCYNA